VFEVIFDSDTCAFATEPFSCAGSVFVNFSIAIVVFSIADFGGAEHTVGVIGFELRFSRWICTKEVDVECTSFSLLAEAVVLGSLNDAT
tara:strand:+ start:7827 stop:8093 length:267 start_codon:yes stop_codon:yes gene_type:complete